jgi:SpoVK/Ycf46/Vps4 family AAA+-type ATPase
MDKVEKLITKYFDKTNVQINMDDVIIVLSKHNITIEELEKILFDVKSNLSFFENELGMSFSGIFISNLLSYAIDAIYISENKWVGSKNRNRITREYKLILNGDKSKLTKLNDVSEISNTIFELNSLIGLDNIKEEVRALTALANVRKKKIELGVPVTPNSLHMVFTGNPGTGKTTVARLIGYIYKNIGLLSNGHIVETSRKDLIGQYVGHTAPLVEKKFKEAEGGILFIDEAYSLTTYNGTNDFGSEAIQILLKLMEDDRQNTVVIVAGYPNEMKKFIYSNPGLQSRFSTYINFEDYSTEQLLSIFKLFVQQDEHNLTDSAFVKLSFILEDKFENNGNVGNARYIRNLYERVQKKQAERLSKSNLTTKYELSTITDEDIPNEV